MAASLQAYDIRKLVAHIFEELGATIGRPSDLNETLLIDEGRCAARSYAAGGLMAMWLIDVGIVQFYDLEGNMLCTVNLTGEDGSQHRRIAA